MMFNIGDRVEIRNPYEFITPVRPELNPDKIITPTDQKRFKMKYPGYGTVEKISGGCILVMFDGVRWAFYPERLVLANDVNMDGIEDLI